MIVSVIYHLAAGQKFDLDYYVKSHVPLVNSLLGPHGLKRTQFLHGTGAPSGAPSAELIALLEFDSLAEFAAAMEQNGGKLMGDIANFTDAQPSIQFNELI
ncbi:EthD family reductase [Rhodopila sp.]|uniref:EthD family reductase n=1 Tax=Rhodopila sp. TaxID=2480087 RepID=UPI003D105EA9